MTDTPAPPAIYRTVGELKAALADVPDDIQIATRGRMGFWENALHAGWLEIKTVGEGKEKVAVSVDDPIFENWKGPQGVPFRVIAFD